MGTRTLKKPHTTPTTIVYETTIYPPLFSAECNLVVDGVECGWHGQKRHEIGQALEQGQRHQVGAH